MPVGFLLGASGSGKSSALRNLVIRRSLAEPLSRHIVFVPEQSTFTTQQAFIAAHPRQAMLNIEVISFGHLARRVFREFSAEKAKVLDENGKQMLLTLAAEDVKKDLTVYAKQIRRPGFLAKLGSLFAEWDMNDISPDRLLEIAGEAGIRPLLAAKLKELSRIYRAFKARLGNGTVTAEETLPRLLRLLPRSNAARGAYLYFDGFTGFTRVQYRLITELIRRSRESLFVFTLPKAEEGQGRKAGREHLFRMSTEALEKIKGCAADAGMPLGNILWAEDVPSPVRRADDLAFLEKHLMRFGKETYPEVPQHIEAVGCLNLRTECRAAVLEVLRLAREEGLRWREIALTVGDKERYVPALEEDLKEAGIPYFTDRRAPLGRHPLIRMLEAALDAVTGNYERDSVLRYLKNECGPLTREESDVFENYLLSAGIRRGASGRNPMTGPYGRLSRLRYESDEAYEARREETLPRMNALRERALGPLQKLHETVGSRGSRSTGEMAEAVLEFLESIGVGDKLAARAERFRAAGQSREAEEWEKVLETVNDFFTHMKELLGGMRMSAQDFCLLAKTGLDSLKLGSIPAEPDQLVIGDVQRSRYNDIKALLVLGMNDGVIPNTGRSGGIITDRERVQLEKYEPDLGYTDERALFEERFYVYRLLTRPSERLYLSFSESGGDGKPIGRSPVLKEIEELFPKLEVRSFGEICRNEPLRAVAGKETAARALAERIRLRKGGWEELYAMLLQSPDFAARLGKLEQGALRYYRPVPLTPEQAEALFGTVLRGSVTRLERFSECPYRHFLQYGLGLEERDEMSWEAADHGTFFHKVMEVILRSVKESGKRLKDLSSEEREELVRKGIGAAVRAGSDTELQDKADREYLLGRWKDLFARQIGAMAEMEADDGFLPESFELQFGGDELALDLGGGRSMRLSGQIDRLDVWKNAGTDWIRVVDYKTSDHSLDGTKLHAGLQLQLFTYLNVAVAKARAEGKNAMPGGLYYAVLTDKWTDKDLDDPEKQEQALNMCYRLTGLTAQEAKSVTLDAGFGQYGRMNVVRSSTLETVGAYVRGEEVRLGREILGGKITIAPAAEDDGKEGACKFCDFRSICRFDERIPGMKARIPDKLSMEEFCQEVTDAAKGKEAAR